MRDAGRWPRAGHSFPRHPSPVTILVRAVSDVMTILGIAKTLQQDLLRDARVPPPTK